MLTAEVRPGPYGVGDVAKMLGVHRDTVQRWCREGLINAVKLPNGYYRIPASAIDEYVAKLTKVPVLRVL